MREGRLIFQNLRKVIAYQIAAGCYSELLPVLATFFFGVPQPLSSFLMVSTSAVSTLFSAPALLLGDEYECSQRPFISCITH